MKPRSKSVGRALGAAMMMVGALAILTPWLIFPVCLVGRHAPPGGAAIGRHGCHATLRAETGLGVVAIGLGVVPLLWPRRRVNVAAAAALLGLAGLIVLFPLAITGVCKAPDMACRIGTLPALATLSILAGIAGAGFLAASLRGVDLDR